MSSSLNDLIEKNVDANKRLLSRSSQKTKNQKTKEVNLKRKFKKNLIYGVVFSALALSIYGGVHCWNKHKDYVTRQKKKITYYQHKFDDVKHYYNRDYFVKADELSEKLQDEMDKEGFFSPTNDLYNKVKVFDNKYIDPEIKRIKLERFYKNLNALPKSAIDSFVNWWKYDAAPEAKAIIYICGIGLAIYLWRKI